jgi:hypothetical protein
VLYLQDLVYEDSGSDTSDSAHSFNQINSELFFFFLKLPGTVRWPVLKGLYHEMDFSFEDMHDQI